MLNEHLDFSQSEYKALLDNSTEMVLRQFQTVQNQKGYHDHPQAEVEQWFDEKIPELGMDVLTLLDEVEQKVLHTAT